MSESDAQARIRAKASSLGIKLWRNNVGAMKTPGGSFVRYGLANDSAMLNEIFKSSDLIGIKPVTITPEMVGTVIGQFIAREVKHEGWKYTGTQRERAQKAFLDLVNKLGGDANFTTGETEGDNL